MGRILIVDDEATTRDSISRALRRKGYETISAANASDALVQVEQHWLDLIISDICMQGGDGFELLQTIRANPRTGAIPFIIITGNADRDGMLYSSELVREG